MCKDIPPQSLQIAVPASFDIVPHTFGEDQMLVGTTRNVEVRQGVRILEFNSLHAKGLRKELDCLNMGAMRFLEEKVICVQGAC